MQAAGQRSSSNHLLFLLLEIFLGWREIARANPMNTEQVHGGIEGESAVEGERIAYLPNPCVCAC